MITHFVSVHGHGVTEHTVEAARKCIYTMEKVLLSGEQIELPIQHEFAFGIYLRKIYIPKGIALTGRVHKQDDLQIVFSGDISIATENGLTRFSGFNTFTSKAGIKPFAFAHEDTWYATAHHTHLTDLSEIEKELFEDEPDVQFDFATGSLKQEALPCRQH
jgi:hypothetical protein